MLLQLALFPITKLKFTGRLLFSLQNTRYKPLEIHYLVKGKKGVGLTSRYGFMGVYLWYFLEKLIQWLMRNWLCSTINQMSCQGKTFFCFALWKQKNITV
jgi:hypothetical protein